MFLPEEVDWQFHNQLQPKFLFLPCYKYFTKSVLNLQGLSQSDWGSYELDVHHFLPLLVLDSSHRSAKMLEVRKKNVCSELLVSKSCALHIPILWFNLFEADLLHSLWKILLRKVQKENKEVLAKKNSFWKNLLSDSYKKSFQTSANKLRYLKFYEGNSPGLIKVWLWAKMQMKCLNSFFYYLFQKLTLPCI